MYISWSRCDEHTNINIHNFWSRNCWIWSYELFSILVPHASSSWRKKSMVLQKRQWELQRFTRSSKPWIEVFAEVLRYAFQCHKFSQLHLSSPHFLSICERSDNALMYVFQCVHVVIPILYWASFNVCLDLAARPAWRAWRSSSNELVLSGSWSYNTYIRTFSNNSFM